MSSMNAIRRFSVTRLSTRRLLPSIGMRCAPRPFEASLLRESAKLASNKQETIEYLQREFAARGLALPAGIDRALGACAREDMALELLEGREQL